MKPRTAKSKGYSVRNLKYMAKFAETYPDCEFVQQVVAQIPWGHNIVLMDKIANPEERKWYIVKSAQNGWFRNVLVHRIESGLYQRQVLVAWFDGMVQWLFFISTSIRIHIISVAEQIP